MFHVTKYDNLNGKEDFLMGTFVRNEIAKNLAYFRKEKKLTQEDLGQQLGVKRNTVSSWESGINAIDVARCQGSCQ